MRTKLIKSTREDTIDAGRGSGYIETIEYECPCGKGRIIEEHDRTPGVTSHDVDIFCDDGNRIYKIDKSKGTHYWEVVPK